MKKDIKSVQKGYGEGDIFYSTNPKVVEQYYVDRIEEGFRQISSNGDGYPIFIGYKNGKVLFEMGASVDVTVVYQ